MVISLLLAGCASAPAPLPPKLVPTPVSCVDRRPARPAFYGDDEIKGMDDYKVVEALRLDRLRAQKYIGELEDVVDVCERAPRVVTVPK